MKEFLVKYKVSSLIVLFSLIIFLIFYFFFLPKPYLEKIKEMILGKDPEQISISNFLKYYPMPKMPGRLSSFTETFSGTGWKDSEKSDIRQDANSMIITLPLKYELKEIMPATSTLENLKIQEENKICIKKDCLVLESGKIYKNEKLIDLPFEVEKIGKAASFWLLAEKFKNSDKKLETTIYAYDGKKYNKLMGGEFYSSGYSGEFILGAGSDLEFIAGFYGYETKLLKFTKTQKCTDNLISYLGLYKTIDHLTACYAAEDISHWLSSRLERVREIKPLKIGNKNYLFYSKQEPFLAIANQEILLDLTQDLNLNKYQKITPFYLENKVILEAEQDKNTKKYFEFKFLGFDNSKSASWISNSLTKRKAKNAAITKYSGAGNLQFSFSRDGENWISALPGEASSLATSSAQSPALYWKVDLVPDENKNQHFSPFLIQASLSYAY